MDRWPNTSRAHPSTEMAACNRKTLAVVALLLCLVLSAAATSDTQLYDLLDNSCYCHCMIDRCMTTPGATREECAPACDSGCVNGGHPGRIDSQDFCGY
ncbi:hypothetical protein ZIOFF_028667 [Zingiber officinale]|uniref:Uncharacterized protein n=1 Tax=Zingiber officinale TaxID=94328 RepID=A0A8J5GWB6_ZINOF|nr:hypothetical protein ZIOFF_028667 [Zingiber officinale]